MDGWDELSGVLDNGSLPQDRHRAVRRELCGMEDAPPGKSGIVRDRALRDRLRKCLRINGLSPDGFTAAEIENAGCGRQANDGQRCANQERRSIGRSPTR